MEEARTEFVDLLHGPWDCENAQVTIVCGEDGLRIANESDAEAVIRYSDPIACGMVLGDVRFEGTSISGDAVKLCAYSNVLATDGTTLNTAVLNSHAMFGFIAHAPATFELVAKPHSEQLVSRADVDFTDDTARRNAFLLDYAQSSTLILTPDYPAPDNTYLCAFVHTRARAYHDAGLRFDVLAATNIRSACRYTFQGIEVLRLSYEDAAYILGQRTYDSIAVHFVDDNTAKIIEGCNLGDADVFLWCHNPELLYWNTPVFAQTYDGPEYSLSQEEVECFTRHDALISRLNDNPRMHWVFISDFQRELAQQQTGIEFRSYCSIPNFVNPETFEYREKGDGLNKKIVCIRRWDNVSVYALDTVAQTIRELAKRPVFQELDFDLYGTGNHYDALTKDIRGFSNVHLHQHFLTQAQINDVYREHGIALYLSRFDSQGAASTEAAQAGLAVVASDIAAARTYLPADAGLLVPTDDPAAAADVIERLATDSAYFRSCCQACHEKAAALCGYDATLAHELQLFDGTAFAHHEAPSQTVPLLSIAIPAIDSIAAMAACVDSLLNARNSHLLEILVVGLPHQVGIKQLGQNYAIAGIGNVHFHTVASKEQLLDLSTFASMATGRFFACTLPLIRADALKLDALLAQLLRTGNVRDAIVCGFYNDSEAHDYVKALRDDPQNHDAIIESARRMIFRTSELRAICERTAAFTSTDAMHSFIGAVEETMRMEACATFAFGENPLMVNAYGCDDATLHREAERCKGALLTAIEWAFSSDSALPDQAKAYIAGKVQEFLWRSVLLSNSKEAYALIKPVAKRVRSTKELHQMIEARYRAIADIANPITLAAVRKAIQLREG